MLITMIVIYQLSTYAHSSEHDQKVLFNLKTS